MTKEEIRQEAEERVNICTPYHTGSFIQGYIAGAEPRENKIADIKANFDLAIEGRDIKIKELEQELTVQKDQLQEEINLHLHAEEYIKSLEKENAELESNFRICEKNADTYYDQLTKAREIIKDLLEYSKEHWLYSDIKKQAEQFLNSEVEKC